MSILGSVLELGHQTVLLHEAVDGLAIVGERTNGVYVDGTFGRGGHSREILKRLGQQGRLLVFDKDPEAIAAARNILDPRLEIVHGSFASMEQVFRARGMCEVAGVLLDLGVSSPQVDDVHRGFSFRGEGPLDMRMDTSRGQSAAQWLARADERDIREVIKNYGEERFAFQIAQAIVARRAVEPISTTQQLAHLVAHVVKTRERGKNPATRTFQAIRIFINQELEELEAGLRQAYQYLGIQGRLAVISFHSLEDRIVKRFMAQKAAVVQPDRRLPIRSSDLPIPNWKLIARVMPSIEEVERNPRARSAVMRIGERVCLEKGVS